MAGGPTGEQRDGREPSGFVRKPAPLSGNVDLDLEIIGIRSEVLAPRFAVGPLASLRPGGSGDHRSRQSPPPQEAAKEAFCGLRPILPGGEDERLPPITLTKSVLTISCPDPFRTRIDR